MSFKDDDECLAKVAPDEPIFVLRAKDRTAPNTVRFWTSLQLGRKAPKSKLLEAEILAKKMEAWQKAHPDQVKDPD